MGFRSRILVSMSDLPQSFANIVCTSFLSDVAIALTQEAKYVESWPNTTSPCSGWSRLDIPVDRYGGVHSLLLCTSSTLGCLLPATRLASRILLIKQNIKKRTGPAICVLCGRDYYLQYVVKILVSCSNEGRILKSIAY